MNIKLLNQFKDKLEKNVLGVFSKTTDSSIIEIFGLAEFDFIILDNEHGYTNYETLKNHRRDHASRIIRQGTRIKTTFAG